MMWFRVLILLLFINFIAISEVKADSKGLTLKEAISLAGVSDPSLAKIEAKKSSLENEAVAAGQLPDPKAKFAMQNFPTDTFSYDQEPMTQIVMGLSQAFPRGKTLKYKSKKMLAKAKLEMANLNDTNLNIKFAVTKAWLDIFYLQEALKVIDDSKKLLHDVIHATEAAYSTGRQNSQDIVGAELELSVLEDRKIDVNRKLEKARAELAKWIGNKAAGKRMMGDFINIGELQSYAKIEKNLIKHPKILAADAVIEASKYGVQIAKEQYKPGFNLGLNYGMRDNPPNGKDRPDFVSAMVSLDIPIFTGKRQDKKLEASKLQEKSSIYMRDDILRNLKKMLDAEYANWQRFKERREYYKKTVVKKAEENFTASLRAYNQDLTDFSSLMRAQVMELKTKLDLKKIETDMAKAKAALLYLQGGK